MPLMGEVEELNVLCGRRCWRWKDSSTRQEKRSRSDSLGPGSSESFRAGQSPSGMRLGDAFQFSQEDSVGVMRVLRAPAPSSVIKNV